MRYKKYLPSHTYLSLAAEDGSINLTPLIDVVFVVLISFMVIAPMVQTENIALAPAGNITEKNSISQKGLILYVTKDDTFINNKKVLSFKELETLAKKMPKNFPVTLFQDERSHFGTYQKIKNLLEDLGYKKIELVVQSAYEK